MMASRLRIRSPFRAKRAPSPLMGRDGRIRQPQRVRAGDDPATAAACERELPIGAAEVPRDACSCLSAAAIYGEPESEPIAQHREAAACGSGFFYRSASAWMRGVVASAHRAAPPQPAAPPD